MASVLQAITLNRSIRITNSLFAKTYELFVPSQVGHVTRVAERAIEGFEKVLNILLTQAFPTIISVIFTAIYITYLLPISAPVLSLGALIYLYLSSRALHWRRPFLDRVNDCENLMTKGFASTFITARAIKSLGNVQKSLAPLIRSYENYARTAQNLAFASETLFSLQSFITLLISVVSIYGGIYWISVDTGFSAGDFVVIFSYVGIFIGNLGEFWRIRQAVDDYNADIRALSKIERQPSLMSADISQSSTTCPNDRPIIRILKDGQLKQPKLSSMERITIPFGSLVSISGSSGAGKTSFLQAIAKIHHSEHLVAIDDIDLLDIDFAEITNGVFAQDFATGAG